MPRLLIGSSARAAALALLTTFALAGCSAFTPQSPEATPTDFAGIVAELERGGIGVDNVTSGDAGCSDQQLARTAIGFDAKGVDQATPIRIYLYAFRSNAVYDQLRPAVDQCARAYVRKAADYSSVDASPYVFAGSGPWPAGFKDALRSALERAAVGG